MSNCSPLDPNNSTAIYNAHLRADLNKLQTQKTPQASPPARPQIIDLANNKVDISV